MTFFVLLPTVVAATVVKPVAAAAEVAIPDEEAATVLSGDCQSTALSLAGVDDAAADDEAAAAVAGVLTDAFPLPIVADEPCDFASSSAFFLSSAIFALSASSSY